MFAAKVATPQAGAIETRTSAAAARRTWGAPARRSYLVQPGTGDRVAPASSWDFTRVPPFASPRPPVAGSRILQRECTGDHPIGGECRACSEKKRLGLQAKLRVNTPGDAFEQEADRIAAQVAAPQAQSGGRSPPPIQRYAADANGPVDEAPASVDEALAGTGSPLEPALRTDMEQRLGYDFSRVRVHSGAAAQRSARDVNANAYTVGHDIVFGTGRFAPGTHEGRRLVAHELTHVVQQSGGSRSGAVSPPLASGAAVLARDPIGKPPPPATPPSRSEGLTASEWARIREVRRFYNLPERPTESQSTIVGILLLPGGEEVPLRSGAEGGVGGGTHRGGIPRGRGEAFSGGGLSQGNIASHIEGQAAAVLHQRNILEGTLLIEAAPCKVCDSPHGTPNITRALPPGAKLTIVDPETTGTYWSSQRPPQATRGAAPAAPVTPPPPAEGSTGASSTASGAQGTSGTRLAESTGGTPPASTPTAAVGGGTGVPSVISGTGLVEGRGGPVAPITVPEPAIRIGATKAGAEAAGTMLLATLLNRLRSAELKKAVDRLTELIPEIDQFRKQGNDVTVTMVVEVPNQVDIAALIVGIGDPSQVVYFKRMFISSASKHYSTPPTQTSMTANLAPGDPEARDPHEYTLQQQIKLQMGDKYPVPGTEPQQGFHFVSVDLPLPAFTASGQVSGQPARKEPDNLQGIAGTYSPKFEAVFIGSVYPVPHMMTRRLQITQDPSGKLIPRMWQLGGDTYSYQPYSFKSPIVLSGRFALGKGPPDGEWIWSGFEYHPDKGLILEWAKLLDSGLNTIWDSLFSWRKV